VARHHETDYQRPAATHAIGHLTPGAAIRADDGIVGKSGNVPGADFLRPESRGCGGRPYSALCGGTSTIRQRKYGSCEEFTSNAYATGWVAKKSAARMTGLQMDCDRLDDALKGCNQMRARPRKGVRVCCSDGHG
jgi:hypothetical protein